MTAEQGEGSAMEPKPLWKRAAALLAAVGVSIFLAGGISADEGNAEAEPAAALQPTEVVADIPTEYDTLFELNWGGGSLFQLKARLATMGCMANTIWVYDNNQWYAYNQYQVPSTLNKQFIDTYSQFIPAGTLYADCYRICEFRYSDDIQAQGNSIQCETFEFLREHNFFNILPYPVDQTSLCTNDFDPLVQEKVLPLLPLHPDSCIVRQEYINISGYYMNYFVQYNNTYPNSVPIIVVYAPADYIAPTLPSATQQRNKARLLYTEIHELCHINQSWYVAQALQPDNVLSARLNDLWYNTLAGKEFIALTGFTKNSRGNWNLPRNSVYNDIYSTNPEELSAELCVSYMLEHIGVENTYNHRSWKKNRGFVLRSTPIEIDLNTYLTPEIRQWLETYMILPEIVEEEAE